MDLYEVLNGIITEPYFFTMSHLFTSVDSSSLEEEDKALFSLLHKVSTLVTHVENNGIQFIPLFTYTDGSTSFDVSELTDNDFHLLESVDLHKAPLALRSHISGLLWTQKKNYPASQIAAQSYWEAFLLIYNGRKYIEALDPIKRAVCIAQQTNSQALYSEIYDWFCNTFIGEANQISVFLVLRIMELFFEQKNTDLSLIIKAVDSILSQCNDDIQTIEQAYNLKVKCYNKLSMINDATKCNLALAQVYYDYAKKLLENAKTGAVSSVDLFENAIVLFRNNGDSAKAEKVHRELIEVQRQIPNHMQYLDFTYDTSKVIENIKANMDELSFEECIIRLTQYCGFESIDTLRHQTIEELRSDLLSSVISTIRLDKKGKTIVKIPPLDMNNPEMDQDLLELHMFQFSQQTQGLIGDIWVRYILHYIRNRFTIDNPMVDFLTNGNGIIPAGRNTIFQKGIGCFLRGEYYEAMHILAPQMENLFRYIAEEVGGLTSTLSDDGLAQEKVLSSVFSLPELLDAYDNDIIFTFRGLLNEQAGANIRNRIAHGIIEEDECSSGACLYFGALVIKLLSLTSPFCNELYVKSEKLKSFVEPEGAVIQILNSEIFSK